MDKTFLQFHQSSKHHYQSIISAESGFLQISPEKGKLNDKLQGVDQVIIESLDATLKGKIMKNNFFYPILLLGVLAISFLQACSSGNNAESNLAPAESAMSDANSSSQETSTDPYQVEEGTYVFDGQERGYSVYLPESYSDSSEFPLVIYFHGYNMAVTTELGYIQLHVDAAANDFIVAYPESSKASSNSYANWNSGGGDHPTFSSIPDVDDIGAVEVLIDTLRERYNINEDMIFATGFSNGGMMAYKLACQLSDRIAAIASVGGTMSNSTYEECNPSRPVPVIVFHGTLDNNVPFNGNAYWHSVEESISYWVNLNNCSEESVTLLPDLDASDRTTVEKIHFKTCTNDAEAIFYKVIDGGHTWPGASSIGLNVSVIGFTTQDIDANVEMLTFFKMHQLSP